MDKYSLEYIDKLRIHELRDYARKIGVVSPTTMKKDELISKITAIVKDRNDIFNGNLCGNKEENIDFFQLLTMDNSAVLDNLLSERYNTSSDVTKKANLEKQAMIFKKNYDNNMLYSNLDNLTLSFSLRQNNPIYDDVQGVYNVSGFVDIHPEGYGIIRHNGYVPSDNDSYISSALVKKFKLRKGQVVTGKAKYVISGKPRIVYEIEDIDGNNEVLLLKSLDEIENNGIGEYYYLDKFNFKIKQGERHYIESMKLKDVVDLGLDFVEENNTSVKIINIKARPEDNYKSDQKLQIVNIPFNKSELEVVNAVELVVERIKREFEQNKSNIIIVYNFSELIRIINTACEGCVNYNKINSKAVNKIYNLLYLSKYVSNDMSCSVVCIDRNGIPRDFNSLMELDILPLFIESHDSILKK